MNQTNWSRPYARNAAESAYPSLWKGLVAAWLPPGAPKHPNRLIDYSGNGNHGTFQNGTTWEMGKDGRYIGFDGTDDDVIGDTPGKNFPSGGESRTVACWIKSSGWSGDRGLLHWGKDGALPVGANYQLVAGSGGTIHWGNGYGHGILQSTTVVSDNKWHHVVGTYSNTNANIYLDGRLDKTGNHTAATVLDNAWRWGRFQNSNGAWPGQMRGCYVYKRVLSNKEIEFLANGGDLFLFKNNRAAQLKNAKNRTTAVILS